jgi:hypothetical protein
MEGLFLREGDIIAEAGVTYPRLALHVLGCVVATIKLSAIVDFVDVLINRFRYAS